MMNSAPLVDGRDGLPRNVELPAELASVSYPHCEDILSPNLDLFRIKKSPRLDGLLPYQFGEHCAGVGPRDAVGLELSMHRTCAKLLEFWGI